MSNEPFQQENFEFYPEFSLVKRRRMMVDIVRSSAAQENWLGIVESTLKKLGVQFDDQGTVAFEDEQLLPALSEVLECPCELVRELGLSVLRELGDSAEPLLPKMLGLLEDPYSMVRVTAMLAVAGFGDKAKPAIPVLLQWCESSDDMERVMAMENIPRIDSSKLTSMVELLTVESEIVGKGQITAIMALGGIGPAAMSATPVLNRLLNDQSALTRLTAAEAIHAITGDISDSIRVATEMLDDPEWEVRYMAEEHLEQWQGRPRSKENQNQIEIVQIRRAR